MPEKQEAFARRHSWPGWPSPASGLAHFASPQLFDVDHQGRRSRATPASTSTSTAASRRRSDLGLVRTKTRPLAVVGAIGYVAYLAGNVARNR